MSLVAVIARAVSREADGDPCPICDEPLRLGRFDERWYCSCGYVECMCDR